MKKTRIPALLLTALLMAACGGNGHSSSSEPTSSLTSQTSSSEVSQSTSTATDVSSSESSQTQVSSSESSSESNSESSSEQVSTSESSSETSSSTSSSEQSLSTTSEQSSSESSSSSSSQEESDFDLVTEDGTFVKDGNIYTITAAGTYAATGTLNGQILVNAGDDDQVVLELSGTSITYDQNAPIFCLNADKLEISAKKNTVNYVTDNRETKTVDSDDQGEGAISAKCDLKLKGTGSLEVVGHYNNGIHTSDDLEMQKLTVTSTAVNNAFKGKDSLTINSGSITAVAGGNAFKTDNTDISSKGNQRGIITVLDGTINAYSAYDAFDAAYNVDIQGGTINVLTNKYASEYIDIDTDVSKTYLYMRTTTANNSSYRYSLYFYNQDSYQWADATYLTSQYSGRQTYYFYRLSMPANFENFKIYRFNANSENSTTSYVSVSNAYTVNDEYDMFTFSVSSTSITISRWSNYSSSQGGQGGPGGGPGQEGNTDKSTDSAKAFKAANEILISGGKITAKAYDDTVHANGGDALENGETGLGNVTISGGELSLYASDDGIHADNVLTISGGTVEVTYAYEGLEAKNVVIDGGATKVYAKDDGVNAASDTGTPSITVNGGRLDITVGSGDVDGIDSNGNFTQTGGVIITRGAPGQAGGMASGLDVDGTARITGGTFIGVGSLEKTPTLGTGVYTCTFGSNTTFSASTWTLSSLDISFTLTSSYTGTVKVFSSLFTSGTSYTLSNGSSSYNATAR